MTRKMYTSVFGVAMSAALFAISFFSVTAINAVHAEENLSYEIVRTVSEDSVSEEYSDVIDEVVNVYETQQYYPTIEFDAISYKVENRDYAGVVSIPALGIEYPIVSSDDDITYLTHGFDGKASQSGAIFLDQFSSENFDDWNTTVYGHNMQDGTMFGSLSDLMQKDLQSERVYMYVYLEDRIVRYTIFAYENVDTDSAVLATVNNEAEYDQYLNAIRFESESFRDGEFLTYKPRMVTLSTCSDLSIEQKFMVHAALDYTWYVDVMPEEIVL